MLLAITDIQLFQLLKEKIGEKEAEAIVTFVDAKVKENNDYVQEHIKETNNQNLKSVATKEDIIHLRNEFKEDIAKVKEEIGQLRTEIASSKSEIIKWMFLFWIGSVGVICGVIIAILNAYIPRLPH